MEWKHEISGYAHHPGESSSRVKGTGLRSATMVFVKNDGRLIEISSAPDSAATTLAAARRLNVTASFAPHLYC
jgi:hypothetical protein